jgi:sugar O-acyltransferase (sialic acid O-acetyltransferase NeuD family)
MGQKRLALIGAGDLGRQIAHLVSEDAAYELVGFFDDTVHPNQTAFSLPILGKLDAIESVFQAGEFDVLLIAIGYKHLAVREKLFLKFYPHIPFATFIHSTCIIDASASIMDGSILFPGCILDMNAQIGHNVFAYSGLILSHDSSIGHHSFMAPGVKIAGQSAVGQCNFLGIGTVISDHVTTCNHCITGAGSLVVKSLNEPGIYVGMPSRILEK